MYFVEVQGRKLGYEIPRGRRLSSPQGHVVLLVHGAFDNREYWRHVYRHLEARHTPLAIDLPGRGGSEGPALRGASEYLAFFAALVEAIDLPRFVFCGHSMGGSMALQFAMHHAERLSAIIPLSSAPVWEIDQADIDVWDRDPDRALHDNMGYLFARETPEATRRAYQGQLRSTPAASCKADLVTCRSFDLAHRLDEIRVPATVVSGDQEFWIAGSQSLHHGIAGSRLELVPAAGHAIALEQPAALNAVLDRALASIA